MRADGVLLDIDGVLAVSWDALPGAVGTLAWLRAHEVPFCLITNTTTQTRRGLADLLGAAGLEVTPDRIVTAVTATATHLGQAHPDAAVFVLTDGDPGEDLADVRLVDRPEEADVVVIGGACDDFAYPTVNRIFRRIMGGAALVGMHRNLYWRTAEGWELDGGAYIAGLEEAASIQATICGKPAAQFFDAGVQVLGIEPGRTAMVGDDIANDVLGAQAAKIPGILVRTGKFQPSDLAKGTPDVVLGSIADLPGWLDG